MKIASFSIIILLCLVFAGLTLLESSMYQAWDRAVDEQSQIKAKINTFQRARGFAEQLVRRIAIDSQRDPALLELLKQHQIKVVGPVEQTKEAPAAPSAPAQPAPAPANPTPAHP